MGCLGFLKGLFSSHLHLLNGLTFFHILSYNQYLGTASAPSGYWKAETKPRPTQSNCTVDSEGPTLWACSSPATW